MYLMYSKKLSSDILEKNEKSKNTFRPKLISYILYLVAFKRKKRRYYLITLGEYGLQIRSSGEVCFNVRFLM